MPPEQIGLPSLPLFPSVPRSTSHHDSDTLVKRQQWHAFRSLHTSSPRGYSLASSNASAVASSSATSEYHVKLTVHKTPVSGIAAGRADPLCLHRIPLAPAPCVQVEAEDASSDEFAFLRLVCCCRVLYDQPELSVDIELDARLDATSADLIVGTAIAGLDASSDVKNSIFTFSDLSIRDPGIFRLLFSLYAAQRGSREIARALSDHFVVRVAD